MKIIDFRLRPPYGSFLQSRQVARRDITGSFTDGIGLPQPPSANALSADMMLTEMDEAEIVQGVMIGRQTTLGNIPNKELIEITEKFPGRFIPAGSLDPTHRREALRELQNIESLGIRLVTFEPGLLANPMHFDDRRLYPVYGAIEDLGWPLILMAGGMIGPDISYSSPEHLDQVLADFPDMRVVASHGGWP